MSTGYGWEDLRQVCATLLGARHVPERLCGGLKPTWGAITNVHLYLFKHNNNIQGVAKMHEHLKCDYVVSPENFCTKCCMQLVTHHMSL